MSSASGIQTALMRLSETFSDAGGKPGRIWVAYSGGLDSHVLVHALAARRIAGLTALHIDHALHADSPAWAEHCRQVCAALDVAYVSRRVDARPQAGESPEAAARRARYRAFKAEMSAGDWLLTAQHRDDQMETVLLQLLRGAGPRGLAAMPVVADLGDGRLMRPLLDVGREEIRRYAQEHGLRWLDDPSNADTAFDRNYLRHEVIPGLLARWPSASKTLARAARHCDAAASAVAREAETDLHALRDGMDGLTIPGLLALGLPRAREVLRLWLVKQGAPTPTHGIVDRIVSELALARGDASPRVELGPFSLRRFRERMYCVPPLPPRSDWECAWPDIRQPLDLPPGQGRLLWRSPPPLVGLTVRPRRGGEKVHLGDSRPRRRLKDLLRESGVAPWMRPLLPLVIDATQTVVGVPGVSEGLSWRMPQSGET